MPCHQTIHPFYRFPAKVRLSQQSLWLMVGTTTVGNVGECQYQAASSQCHEHFTDLFNKKVESLKIVR